MLAVRRILRCLVIFSIVLFDKVIAVHAETVGDTESSADASGSGQFGLNHNEDLTSGNRSRKDYIIAIENNAAASKGYDPVFQMLSKLARRSHGQLAVMDYGENNRKFGYDETANNEEELPYNEEQSDEDNPSPFEGKQSLIGQNLLSNFIDMSKFGMRDERARERDDIRPAESDRDVRPSESDRDDMPSESDRDVRPSESDRDVRPSERDRDFRPVENSEDMNDDENGNYAPPVVYEMYDGEQNEAPFFKGFGHRDQMFDNENDDYDDKK